MTVTQKQQYRTRIVVNTNQEEPKQQYVDDDGASPASSWSYYQQQLQQRQITDDDGGGGDSSKQYTQQQHHQHQHQQQHHQHQQQQYRVSNHHTASDEVRSALHSIYGDPSVSSSSRNSSSTSSSNRHRTNGEGHTIIESDRRLFGNDGTTNGTVIETHGANTNTNSHHYQHHNNNIDDDDDEALFDGNNSSIAFSLSDIEDETDDSSNTNNSHNRDDGRLTEGQQQQQQHAEWESHHHPIDNTNQVTTRSNRDKKIIGTNHQTTLLQNSNNEITHNSQQQQQQQEHHQQQQQYATNPTPIHNISYGSSSIVVVTTATSKNSSTSTSTGGSSSKRRLRQSNSSSNRARDSTHPTDNPYELPPNPISTNTNTNTNTNTSTNTNTNTNANANDNNDVEISRVGSVTTTGMAAATITPASLFFQRGSFADSERGDNGDGGTVRSVAATTTNTNGNGISPPTVHRYRHQGGGGGGEGYPEDALQWEENLISRGVADEGHLHHHNHTQQPKEQQQYQQEPHQQQYHQQQQQQQQQQTACVIPEQNYEPTHAHQQQQQHYDTKHSVSLIAPTAIKQDNDSKPKLSSQQQTTKTITSTHHHQSNSTNCNTHNSGEMEQLQINANTTTSATMNHAATSPILSLLDNQTTKHQHQQQQQEVLSLQEQIKLIRRERDSLREDINELVQTRGLNRNNNTNTNNTISSSQHYSNQTLERKHQVEIDGLRQVTEEIQADADEKVAKIEGILEQMKKQRELEAENHRSQMRERNELLREKGRQLQQRDKEEKEKEKNGAVWKDSFKSLVEQLCFHVESGALEWNANLPSTSVGVGVGMNKVVLAAVASEGAREIVKKEMGELLHSLSGPRPATRTRKPTTTTRFTDSCVQTNKNDLPMKPSLVYEKKDVIQSISVAVDTADLSSFAHQQLLNNNNNSINDVDDPHSDHPYYNNLLRHQHRCSSGADEDKRITELELENASLRGTNEHLTDQFQLCQKQLQSLKESSGVGVGGAPFISPSSTAMNSSNTKISSCPTQTAMKEEVPYHSTLVNQLQRSNAQHTQSNQILTENLQIIEEENLKVVQRCVDLERVAEEATAECERLFQHIDHLEQNREILTADNAAVIAKLEALRVEQREVLERVQMESVKVEEELMRRIDILERDQSEMLEAKRGIDSELLSLVAKNSHLVLDSKEAEKQLKCLSEQLLALQERSKTWEQDQCLRDKCTNLGNKIQEVEQELSTLLKVKLDLEDDYARLQNVSVLTKAKMEHQESELRLIKKTYETSKKEGSNLILRLESTKAENVMLSDGNTDVEMECNRLKKECEDLRKSLDSFVTEGKRMRNEVITIQRDCSIAVTDKENAELTCKEAHDRSLYLTAEAEAVGTELDSIKKKFEILVEEREERDKLLVMMQGEIDELNKLKKEKKDEHIHLLQQMKEIQEQNDRYIETKDEMTSTQSELEEKVRYLELNKSDWVKSRIEMEAKLELLNLNCTALKDTNKDLRSDVCNLNDDVHTMSAATEIKMRDHEKSRVDMETKLELLARECTSLKDTNENLRSNISNSNEEIRSMSAVTEKDPGSLRLPTQMQVESTPLAPHHITERQLEVISMPIQTPATMDNAIMAASDEQIVNNTPISTKTGLSTVCSCLFESQICSVNHKYKSATSQRTEAKVGQTAVLSDQSMDKRLERLKLANQRASQKLRHVSSASSALRILNKNDTPLIVKNLETASKDSKERSNSCKTGNTPLVSLQETEDFIMNILNSCEKSGL